MTRALPLFCSHLPPLHPGASRHSLPPPPLPTVPSMTIPAAAGPQDSEAAHEPHCASSWQHRSDALTHSAAHGGGVDAVYSSVEYIFGFGSLISHPGFEYSEVVRPCYIKDYRWVLAPGWALARPLPPGATADCRAEAGGRPWCTQCNAGRAWVCPGPNAPWCAVCRAAQACVLAGQHRPPRHARGAGADRDARTLRGGSDGGPPAGRAGRVV